MWAIRDCKMVVTSFWFSIFTNGKVPAIIIGFYPTLTGVLKLLAKVTHEVVISKTIMVNNLYLGRSQFQVYIDHSRAEMVTC